MQQILKLENHKFSYSDWSNDNLNLIDDNIKYKNEKARRREIGGWTIVHIQMQVDQYQ